MRRRSVALWLAVLLPVLGLPGVARAEVVARQPGAAPREVMPPHDSERGTLRTDVTGDGREDVLAFYDYGGGRTRLWVFTGNASGGFDPLIRWESGPASWALDSSVPL